LTRALMISSARPSLKYSLSLSALKLAKASTAWRAALGASARGVVPWLGLEVGRGLIMVRRVPTQAARHYPLHLGRTLPGGGLITQNRRKRRKDVSAAEGLSACKLLV
jgi:hypothetical protein